jgi:hypothetical protein
MALMKKGVDVNYVKLKKVTALLQNTNLNIYGIKKTGLKTNLISIGF